MAGMNVRDDILNKIEKPKPSGRDLAYRAVAAVFGGPVDLTTMVMRPFGYDVEKPVLGSEWIGQQLQDVGLVSEARDPLQEFMASLLVPGGGIEAVPALASKGMAMAIPAVAGVIKGKGGNWLTGDVEKALKPLTKFVRTRQEIDDMGIAHPPLTDEQWAQMQKVQEVQDIPLNAWVKGPLTKYVKTRMASPDDEIRRLADQGVSHVSPDDLAGGSLIHPTGEDYSKLGVSDLGKSWENASDNAIYPQLAGNIPSTSMEEPWLTAIKVDDPATPIYRLSHPGAVQTGDILGFRHLTDELSNALNPESGLPRALQLTPDQMKNLSVEKAVRRVADINKWRANQMAEANKAIAFDEKTAPVFKEYQTVPGYGGGQPNEKGLHWREIKAVGDKAALKKQLSYEGDTMGHCVGGYCDAVLAGESRVYTLRDKAGKPHVTIEVAPGATHPATPADGLPTIVQIKGAKNSAPKDEYVPFIQDFIRNGNFLDVGDIANAQMRQMPDGSFYTTKELEAVLDAMSASPETRAKTSLNWLMKEVEKSPEAWARIKPFLDSLKDQ